jgi:hypothetical protein
VDRLNGSDPSTNRLNGFAQFAIFAEQAVMGTS